MRIISSSHPPCLAAYFRASMQRVRSKKNLVPRLPGAASGTNEESPDRLLRSANRLLHGYGFERDPGQVRELLERAVENGHVDAMYRLAVLLESGDEDVLKDPKRAVALHELAIARASHVSAMTSLATLLLSGAIGVMRDPRHAVVLYSRAIDEGGDDEAMALLACLLHDGVGVRPDKGKAVVLFKRASEVNNYRAMNNLATLSLQGTSGDSQDAQVASALYMRAAAQGSGTSLRNLALLYSKGALAVARDHRQAIDFANEAVVREPSAVNMLLLARLLLSEDTGKRWDPSRGADILTELVSELQYGPAMHELAALLSRGAAGVTRDSKLAEHLRRSASNTESKEDHDEYGMDMGGINVDCGKELDADVEWKRGRPKSNSHNAFCWFLRVVAEERHQPSAVSGACRLFKNTFRQN